MKRKAMSDQNSKTKRARKDEGFQSCDEIAKTKQRNFVNNCIEWSLSHYAADYIRNKVAVFMLDSDKMEHTVQIKKMYPNLPIIYAQHNKVHYDSMLLVEKQRKLQNLQIFPCTSQELFAKWATFKSAFTASTKESADKKPSFFDNPKFRKSKSHSTKHRIGKSNVSQNVPVCQFSVVYLDYCGTANGAFPDMDKLFSKRLFARNGAYFIVTCCKRSYKTDSKSTPSARAIADVNLYVNGLALKHNYIVQQCSFQEYGHMFQSGWFVEHRGTWKEESCSAKVEKDDEKKSDTEQETAISDSESSEIDDNSDSDMETEEEQNPEDATSEAMDDLETEKEEETEKEKDKGKNKAETVEDDEEVKDTQEATEKDDKISDDETKELAKETEEDEVEQEKDDDQMVSEEKNASAKEKTKNQTKQRTKSTVRKSKQRRATAANFLREYLDRYNDSVLKDLCKHYNILNQDDDMSNLLERLVRHVQRNRFNLAMIGKHIRTYCLIP